MNGEDSFRHDSPPLSPSASWKVTLGDLITLMLTFFVMLFAVSTPKGDKFKELADVLSKSLNPVKEDKKVGLPTAQFNISTVFRRRAINLEYLDAVITEKLKDDAILKRAHVHLLDDRLIISLPGDLLFGPGSALLSANGREAVFALGGVLRTINNQIGINGHSDSSSTTGKDYASNWELSLARSIAVGNALRRAGYLDDIVAFGFGDSLFGDVSAELPVEKRNALGRRVDIMVMPIGGGT